MAHIALAEVTLVPETQVCSKHFLHDSSKCGETRHLNAGSLTVPLVLIEQVNRLLPLQVPPWPIEGSRPTMGNLGPQDLIQEE